VRRAVAVGKQGHAVAVVVVQAAKSVRACPSRAVKRRGTLMTSMQRLAASLLRYEAQLPLQ
jgi:hypothetical protein